MKPVRLGSVSIPPITFAIIATLVVCFLVIGIVAKWVPSVASVLAYFPVTTGGVLGGQVWRLLSYALVHDLQYTFHLIFNCLFIYMFGKDLEERWGAGRYLLFMFVTVLLGGIFVVVGGYLELSMGAAIGSSAFAEGLMVAWGLTYRDRDLRFMFALQIKGIHMVWIAVALWILDAVSQSPYSAAAHLGGMVAAAVLVLGVWRPNYVKDFFNRMKAKATQKKQPSLFVVPPPKDNDKKWVN